MSSKKPAKKKRPQFRGLKKLRRWKLTRRERNLGVAIIVVLAAVYLFYVRPIQAAFAAYQSRVNSSTLSYSGSLVFLGHDFLSALDSNVTFNGEYQSQPLAASLNFAGNWANQSLSGQFVATGSRLYAKLVGNPLPTLRYKQSSFVLPLKPQWYSAKFDESLFDNVCQNSAPPKPADSLAFYSQVKTLRLNNSWLIGLWDPRGVHFHGTLPSSQLQALLQSAQAALPAGCDLNTIGFGAADAKNIQTSYDLFANPAGDQLQVALVDRLGAHLVIKFNTSHYGQPVKILAPTQSVDLNAIYARVTPNYFENAP